MRDLVQEFKDGELWITVKKEEYGEFLYWCEKECGYDFNKARTDYEKAFGGIIAYSHTSVRRRTSLPTLELYKTWEEVKEFIEQTSRWIESTRYDCVFPICTCEKCNGSVSNMRPPFCPWCGRRMRGIKVKGA